MTRIARTNAFVGSEALVERIRPEELSVFQQIFVREYLIDLNAVAAFIRAGGDPFSADRQAPRLLKKGSVVARHVRVALAERAARVDINADRVLRELGRVTFGDPRTIFREDGTLKAPHEYSADDAVLIEGVKTRRIVEVGPDGKMQQAEIQEVKLVNKLSAINTTMKHLGMLNDKLDITVTSVATRLEEAVRRTGRAPARDEEDEESDEDRVFDASYAYTPAPQPQRHDLDAMLGVAQEKPAPELSLDEMLGRK